MPAYKYSHLDLERFLQEKYSQFYFLPYIQRWINWFSAHSCCGERLERFAVFYKTSMKRANGWEAYGCRWCGRVDLD